MTPISGLLFDKDGTLFDFRATWGGWTRRLVAELSQGDALRTREISDLLGFDLATGDFAKDSLVIAHTTSEICEVLLGTLAPVHQATLLERMNVLASQNDMVEAVALKPLFAGFKAAGLKVGLATNDAEMPAKAHLASAGISEYFDFVAGFDSGWGGKPDTGQMQAFLRQTALPPASVAMVGDSLHDLDAGRAAGMRTVGVLTGIASRQALTPHADVVLDTIDELPEWIAAQS